MLPIGIKIRRTDGKQDSGRAAGFGGTTAQG